jgi:hypothetical protein
MIASSAGNFHTPCCAIPISHTPFPNAKSKNKQHESFCLLDWNIFQIKLLIPFHLLKVH